MRGEIREKSGSFVGDSRENGVFWRNLRKNGEIWGKRARDCVKGARGYCPQNTYYLCSLCRAVYMRLAAAYSAMAAQTGAGLKKSGDEM